MGYSSKGREFSTGSDSAQTDLDDSRTVWSDHASLALSDKLVLHLHVTQREAASPATRRGLSTVVNTDMGKHDMPAY